MNVYLIIIMIYIINHKNAKANLDYKGIYQRLSSTSGPTTSYLVNELWRQSETHSSKDEDTIQCYEDVKKFKNGVSNGEEWALKMLDSSAHVQSGFLEGNIINAGNYDECSNINNTKLNIEGKYCTVGVSLPDEKKHKENLKYSELFQSISIALCVPASCQNNVLDSVVDEQLKKVKTNFSFSSFDCQTETRPEKLDRPQIIILVFFTIIGILLLFGTIYDAFIKDTDIYNKLFNGNVIGFPLTFSICLNGNNLLKEDRNNKTIKCIYGIRFISACGIVIVHRNLRELQPFTNLFTVDDETAKWYNTFIINAYLFVDVFFLMSGLLISYSFLRKLKEEEDSFNPLTAFFHRYFRLTPALAVTIMLTQFLNILCEGLNCYQTLVIYEKSKCEKNWPFTLLYITNFLPVDQKCLPHSWYLTADMQLYVFSFILLIIMAKINRRKFIFFLLMLLLMANFMIVFSISYRNKIPSIPIAPMIKNRMEAEYIYEPFYTRAGPWLIGFGLGILINEYNENATKMSNFSVVIGWMFSIICITSASFGMYPFLQSNYKHDHMVEYIYKTFYRSIWAFGFAWIIYACHTGHGGTVNRFLSCQVFQPLSRLSYCLYLIHPFIQILQFGEKTQPRQFSIKSQIVVYVGDIFYSILAALILYLVVEAPTTSLEKLWRSNKDKHELQRMCSNKTEVESLDE